MPLVCAHDAAANGLAQCALGFPVRFGPGTGGLIADSFTYSFVLKVVGVLKLSVEGRKAHGAAVKIGFRWDAYTASSMMEMYTMLDRADVARKLFDEMPQRALVL